MDAIFAIDKPVGPTSHDVVARIRRAARLRRVGHAGTLDPLASGVLVVALGNATRLVEYLTADDKAYRAVIAFGSETATDDAEGDVTRTAPAGHLNAATITAALDAFRGTITQVPPSYSAISVGGERLHAMARRGVAVEAPPRRVTIDAIDLVAWDAPRATIDIACGKGTYVRSIARDLGVAVGSAAHLANLRRTRSGTFRIDAASALEVVEAALRDGSWPSLAVEPATALPRLPAVRLAGDQVRDVAVGRPIEAMTPITSTTWPSNDDGQGCSSSSPGPTYARAIDPDGRLVAILRQAAPNQWHPAKVLSATGVS
jgi:tRNA pseudouridine55 synthase